MKTSGSKKRKVRFIGVCGPSASGKSTVTRRICETVGSPAMPIEADWFFKADLPPSTIDKHCKHCWEEPASVDSSKLRKQLQHVRKTIEGAGYTMPSLKIHGTKGKIKPIDAEGCVGKKLKYGTVWIIVEGFLLFADKKLVKMLKHCLWLSMDAETGAVRRFKRNGGKDPCNDSNPKFKSFRKHYIGHIYAHFKKYKNMQLKNAEKKLVGKIDVSPPPEEVAKKAVKLLSGAMGADKGKKVGGGGVGMSSLKGYFSKKKKFDWVKPSKGDRWWLSEKGMHETKKGAECEPKEIEMLGGTNFILWKYGHVYMLDDKTGAVFVHTGKENGITHVARAQETKGPECSFKTAKPDEKQIGWLPSKVVPSSVWGVATGSKWRWDTRHGGPVGTWRLKSADGGFEVSEHKEVDGKEVHFTFKARMVTPTAFIVPKFGHLYLLDRPDKAVRVWNGTGLKYSASPFK